MTVSQLSAQFQSRLSEITSKIRYANGIDSNGQGILINEVRKIGQEFNEAQRRLQMEWDRIRDERNQLYSQVEEADRQLRTAITDRDRANIEKENLQAELQELRLKAKKSSDKLIQMEQHWKRTNEDLVKELAFKDEQLKGKRALWMDSHPGSSARRDAMSTIRDPFTSPTASHKSRFDSNPMGIMTTHRKTDPLQTVPSELPLAWLLLKRQQALALAPDHLSLQAKRKQLSKSQHLGVWIHLASVIRNQATLHHLWLWSCTAKTTTQPPNTKLASPLSTHSLRGGSRPTRAFQISPMIKPSLDLTIFSGLI